MVSRLEELRGRSLAQRAIINSANFSSIATDAKGVIQIFNVGAERMLGYTAAEVMNKITRADTSSPGEASDSATSTPRPFAGERTAIVLAPPTVRETSALRLSRTIAAAVIVMPGRDGPEVSARTPPSASVTGYAPRA